MNSDLHPYVPRRAEKIVLRKLGSLPAVALLGPRQCGKTTLAKTVIRKYPDALYLDLERPSDLNRLRDPEAFLSLNKGRLVCLDEIQRRPSLFPVLRSIIDETGQNRQFLILGSATPELLRQSSETLAGRISYVHLTPFEYREIRDVFPNTENLIQRTWLRGGFPRSFLAENDGDSFEWRIDFIRTFLERDIPMLGFRVPAEMLRRLWTMLAHVSGQVFNPSRLGASLGVSYHTARKYMDMLKETFMVRILPAYAANVKKRLIKSPKCYVRDTGIMHGLLSIDSHDVLYGHPAYGHSWETFAVEQIMATAADWNAYYYRTSTGNEVDMILERGQRRIAVECKASTSPEVSRGLRQALEDLEITEAWIAAPVSEAYPAGQGIMIAPPHEIAGHLD